MKPGVNGPHRDAGHQVTGNRRELQPVRDRAEHEGKPEPDHEHGNERRLGHGLKISRF